MKSDKVLCMFLVGFFKSRPYTKHNSCLLLTVELANRNVLVT